MPVFGNRPEDAVTDLQGNALSGQTITAYASQADANAQATPLGSANTDTRGRWPLTIAGRSTAWVRDSNGNVWPVSAGDATVADFTDQVEAAQADAAASAASAQAAANLVGAPADSAIAAAITPGSGSASEAVLNSTYAALPADPAEALDIYFRGPTNVPNWTTSQEVVARALGWAIVTDKTYGGKGDGTDDKAAFQDAVDAKAAAGGGTVYAPYTSSGYGFATGLTIKSRVTVTAAGGVTFKAITSARTYMVSFAVNAVDAGLNGVRLDANGFVTAAVLNLTGPLTRPKVVGCNITDTFTAIYGVQVSGAVANSLIEHNTFDGLATSILLVNDHTGTKVRHNKITNWKQRGIYVLGDATRASTDLTLDGNHISSIGAGGTVRYPIVFSGVDAAPHTRPRVLNNTVIGPGTAYADTTTPGTADQISLSRTVDAQVIGNTSLLGGDMGITVALSNTRATLIGNICRLNNASGICIGDSTSSFDKNISVTGNVCMGNGQDKLSSLGDQSRAGIRIYGGTNIAVSGNTLGDDQATKTQKYGVSMTSCTNVVLGPDVDAGNVLATYFKDGAANTNITKVATAAF